MNIVINGETRSVSEGLNAQQLLEQLGLSQQKVALEVNQEIVPRSVYMRHIFQAGDRVEIIHAIGGG